MRLDEKWMSLGKVIKWNIWKAWSMGKEDKGLCGQRECYPLTIDMWRFE